MNASWLKYLPGFLREKLQGRHQLQAVLGNSGWLFADKAVRMGGGLLLTIWIARYLGPVSFGQLSYAIAFVALFGAIATLGMDGLVVRELVREPENTDEILGSAFGLRLIGSCLAVLVAVLGVCLVRPGEAAAQALVAIVAVGTLFQAVDIVDLWFQSRVQSRFTVIARNLAFIAMLLIRVALILTQASVAAFAWAASAELALAALALAVSFHFQGRAWAALRPRLARMRALFSEAWPLLVASLAVLVYMRIDQVMLAAMLGEREVGLYAAAVRLSEMWYVIPTVLVSSVMPSLTEARARSEELYYQRLQRLFNLLARAAYLVAIPVSLCAGPLMRLLYGESYAAAGTVLAVHVWTVVFVFVGVAYSPWIINERRSHYLMLQTSSGACFNVLLNLWLIPSHGAVGCAIAAVLAQALAVWLANSLFAPTRRIFRMQAKALLGGLTT
ncbi:MAG: flippase [Sterolibacterium sp.]|nr:flippase [Sterolibacterium sp.]